MVRPEISITESPPSGGEPERQVNPVLPPGRFEHHDEAARSENALYVPHRLPQVTCRVKHICGDHDVEAASFETLRSRVSLEVEEL